VNKKKMKRHITELANKKTKDIDRLPTLEIVARINQEDARVPRAIRKVLPQVAQAVDLAVECIRRGGRVFYFGAGTSGRIGVLDASELPPTYNTPPDLVQGVIAGGDSALRRSAEAAEDDIQAGYQVARQAGVKAGDVIVAITASGGAPWVLGVAQQARRQGARVIALVCSPGGPLEALADIVIAPIVGPEVIAGSTRMKAGSAQKMVLNMLSTATMIRLGKVYGNLMVDVRASNQKLRQRAVSIVQQITGVDKDTAISKLSETGYEVKPALVMLLADVDLSEARRRLDSADGLIRNALESPIEP
jgi:N-acetylmuramic acid 6-phosphate etherase